MFTILTPPKSSQHRRNAWLKSTCSSFTESTGWILEFTPAGEIPRRDDEWCLNECCWQAEITDGTNSTGLVHLHAPEDFSPPVTFESAYRLAELITGNINRFLHQQAQVYEQAVEIGRLVGAKDQSDLRNRVRALLRAGICLAGFRCAALFILEPDGSAVRLRMTHQIELSDIPARRRQLDDMPPDLEALRSGLTLIQRDGNSDEQWIPRSMNSAVCLPVNSESGPIGTLWFFDRRFKEADEIPADLLKGFAGQIADMFERVVLLQDSEACDRLARELDVIASTTADIREVVASYPGCDVAVRCLSRCEVGGDLCEIVPFDEHRTIFVIGDASGDSIPAAMVMTATRGALHALLEVYKSDKRIPTPHVFVGELNRAILHVTAAQQFITLVFGVFDSRTGTLVYTNAGHCPPLHVHDGSITSLDSQGLLLGVLEEATYTTARLTLEPGQQLIFFSDGIIEARDRNENMFRNEGILDAIDNQMFESASETLRAIWSQYEIHTGGRNLDDRTLMVIRGATTESSVIAEATFSGSRQVY